jgi:anthranilate synthase/aminodeoxychorismate synthase-like glutamine amidotransferase
MIAMIDNYDSFTYNIVQELREMEADLRVFRNDALTVDELDALAPAALVVSPGPGRPSEAGISMDAIRRFAGRIPILGVCLGHQAIGEVYGGRIVKAARIMHGKVSEVTCDGEGVFKGLGARPFKAMRYHSLCIDPDTMPDCLQVTATAEDGCIMGVRHKELQVHGVQFHPESIMTPSGKRILRNFLRMAE